MLVKSFYTEQAGTTEDVLKNCIDAGGVPSTYWHQLVAIYIKGNVEAAALGYIYNSNYCAFIVFDFNPLAKLIRKYNGSWSEQAL